MATTTLAPVQITDRRPNMRGRMETWEARTPDGTWLMVRTEEPGTPWWVQHLALRLTTSMGSLRDVRAGIAGNLRATMVFNARRDLIRAGRLLGHHTHAEGYCECGAPIAEVDGAWVHIDGCRTCVDHAGTTYAAREQRAPAEATWTCCDPCPNDGEHVVCGEVRPVTCGWCDGVAPAAPECERGHAGCDGCCEPEVIDYDR